MEEERAFGGKKFFFFFLPEFLLKIFSRSISLAKKLPTISKKKKKTGWSPR